MDFKDFEMNEQATTPRKQVMKKQRLARGNTSDKYAFISSNKAPENVHELEVNLPDERKQDGVSRKLDMNQAADEDMKTSSTEQLQTE